MDTQKLFNFLGGDWKQDLELPKAPFVAGMEDNDNEENEIDEDKLNDFRIKEEDLT